MFTLSDLKYDAITRDDAKKLHLKKQKKNFGLDFVKCDILTEMNLAGNIFCAIGIFPLSRNAENGILIFKVLSFKSLYTVLLFLIQTGFYIHYIDERLEFIRVNERGIDNIEMIATISFALIHWAPIALLLDMKRISTYLNQWRKYQDHYESLTGQPLHLELKQLVRRTAIVAFIATLSLEADIVVNIVMNINNSSWTFVRPLYVYNIFYYLLYYHCILCASVMSGWFIINNMLVRASKVLQEDLKNGLSNPNQQSLQHYHDLWLHLSDLTVNTGKTFCCTLGFFLLYIICNVIITMYETCSKITFSLEVLKIQKVVNCLAFICVLFFIPNSAHKSANAVGEELHKILVNAKMTSFSKEKQSDLQCFIQIVENNRPSIDLGGFCTLNRGLLTSITGTIVTYLVVLLQFKVSSSTKNSIQDSI